MGCWMVLDDGLVMGKWVGANSEGVGKVGWGIGCVGGWGKGWLGWMWLGVCLVVLWGVLVCLIWELGK